MRIMVETAQRQEDPTYNLDLTQLRAWQKALDVPIAELIEEPDKEFSPLIQSRTQIFKLGKTVASVLKTTEEKDTRILAEMMQEQLAEIMPEAAEADAWQGKARYEKSKDPGISQVEVGALPEFVRDIVNINEEL